MLRIRLRRTGTKNKPFFRVVVSDRRKTPQSSFLEDVGHYNPRALPGRMSLKLDRIDAWVKRGARPSETVEGLIRAARSGQDSIGASVIPEKDTAKKASSESSKAPADAEKAPKLDAEPEASPSEEKAPEAKADGVKTVASEKNHASKSDGQDDAKAHVEDIKTEPDSEA